MRKRVGLVILALLAIHSAVFAQSPASPDKPDIEELIKRLGDDRWRVREAATNKLVEIGQPALSALRKAILSDDPEVSTRAQFIYKRIVGVWPEQLEAFRKEIQLAFRAADYGEMIQLANRLTAREAGNLADWLWLGHACQLAGKWKEAVAAYQNVGRLVDESLKPRAGAGAPGEGPGPRKARRIIEAEAAAGGALLRQRTILAWRIAQMQMGELKDPKAAAAGLARAVEVLEKARAQVDHLQLSVLRDLAAARHDSGDLAGAFVAWAKLQRACRGDSDWGGYVDVQRIADALAALPPGRPLPDVPAVFVLTPARAEAKLMLNEDETRKRSYLPSSPDSPHWRYAFAPAPGKEFATLEFACDIEQLKPRCGGHFSSYVVTDGEDPGVVPLGGIGWSGDEPTGRKICRKKVNVPPGVRLVHVTTGSWKGYFNIHSIQVEATFRPVTKSPRPLRPPQDVWVSAEALPAGGTLTCGQKTSMARHTVRMPPGRYRVRYVVPGRKDRFEADVAVGPGGRCPLFINLDSPFRWSQTNLRRLRGYRVEPARLSIVRLADASYLAVWCARESTIMLARSRDLLTWTKPKPAPFNSIFQDIAPATLEAADGTVWVAFFSKRLTLRRHTTGGYSLFLTGTRDGRKWSWLKPVLIATVDGWPVGAPHMLHGPDGKYWIFWRKYAAAGKSLGDIHQLRPIHVERGNEKWTSLRDQHVLTDQQRLFHMLFSNFGSGIFHTTSEDGLNWAAPRALVAPKRGRHTGNPRLIFTAGKPLLLYGEHGGAYLLPVPPVGRPAQPGQGLKITNRAIPLHASGMRLTAGGEVLLLAGNDTLWLLRATLKDLAAVGN